MLSNFGVLALRFETHCDAGATGGRVSRTEEDVTHWLHVRLSQVDACNVGASGVVPGLLMPTSAEDL